MEMKGLHKSILFSEFLKPSQIVFDLKTKDKVEAIEELLDILVKQKLVANKKLTLTRIIDRENLETTAVGEGVVVGVSVTGGIVGEGVSVGVSVGTSVGVSVGVAVSVGVN